MRKLPINIVVALFILIFNSTLVIAEESLLTKTDWSYGILGSEIGKVGFFASDIDNDGKTEIVTSGTRLEFGDHQFWYILRENIDGSYEQVWRSKFYKQIRAIAVEDLDSDGIAEIIIMQLRDNIEVYNSSTHKLIHSIPIVDYVKSLIVADLDGDDHDEIIYSEFNYINIISSKDFKVKSRIINDDGALSIGNLDNDPALEIISINRKHGGGFESKVIDGVSLKTQWIYPGKFGELIQTGDVDNDGIDEIISASEKYIKIYDANTKTIKATINTGEPVFSLRVTDTNKDSIPEILYMSHFGELHCRDGNSHQEMWVISSSNSGGFVIEANDLDNDGSMELIYTLGAANTKPEQLIILDLATFKKEWESTNLKWPINAFDVGDVDDDHQDEIIMISNFSDYSEGQDGSIVNIFDLQTKYLERQIFIDEQDVRSVKIGDVDNDGDTEFVMTTGDCISVFNGKSIEFEVRSNRYPGNYFTDLEIADLDSDGDLEIIAGQGREYTIVKGSKIVVFDGSSKTPKWESMYLDTGWREIYDVLVEDIDNDNNLEVLATVKGRGLCVFDGQSHKLDYLLEKEAYSIAVANIDEDPNSEILLGLFDGTIQVIDGLNYKDEGTILPITYNSFHNILSFDINNDGTDEIIVSDGFTIRAYSYTTETIVWESELIGIGNLSDYKSQFYLKDIDNDLRPEVLFNAVDKIAQFEIQTPFQISVKPQTIYLHPTTSDAFSSPISLQISHLKGDPLIFNSISLEGLGGELVMISNTCSSSSLKVNHSCEVKLQLPQKIIESQDAHLLIDFRNPYSGVIKIPIEESTNTTWLPAVYNLLMREK